MTTSIDEARVREILAECADNLAGLSEFPSRMSDGPGAVSAFYTSLSFADVVGLCTLALSAIASRQAVVKPLEWNGLAASTPFGDYEIARYGKYWAVYLYRDLIAEPESEEAAKAAAQADYTQRIRSALE